jgi:hypothetical protein
MKEFEEQDKRMNAFRNKIFEDIKFELAIMNLTKSTDNVVLNNVDD